MCVDVGAWSDCAVCSKTADDALNSVVWAVDSVETAIDATVSCLIGSAGCIALVADSGIGGAGGSVTIGVTVCAEIDGVACWANGWSDGSVCVGVACCMWGEGTEVVDGADVVGAWLRGDVVG